MPRVPSPELRALSAAVARACGVEPAPPPPPEALDRDELDRLVARHQVAGLAERGGTVAGAEGAARAQRVALFSLHLAAFQSRVLRVLGEAGVPAVVLKGIALSAEGYGDVAVRLARDVDLLVAPADVGRAVAALREAGLDWYGWQRPDDPDRPEVDPSALERIERLPLLRDVTLVDGSGVQLEVHWRLFANTHLMPVDPAWLAAPHTVEVHGEQVPTLPPHAHLAYVLVHGTHHLWSVMKWLADVPALVVRRPELGDVERLRAAGGGNDRSLATGLLVAEATFGPFLPPALRSWARGVRGTRLLVRRSLEALAAPEDRPKVVTPRALPAEVAGRLALRPDTAYRREELRLVLLTAGRAHGVEDPRLLELATGPARWALRALRRRRAPTSAGTPPPSRRAR